MFSRFKTIHIPLYIALIAVVLVALASVILAFEYRDRLPASYRVLLPLGARGNEFIYGSWPELSNADFFATVRSRFIEERTNFIAADISGKQLTVYIGGVPTLTVPILATGRTGSWWETPAGLYKIDGKERSHYSAFSGVTMPWALPFQGNFFIHGWPSYPDGTPVAPGYSGGCVRLSTEDASRVYDLATVGMSVLVFKNAAEEVPVRFAVRPPQISATQYLAADLATNFVFAERDSSATVPIASITKLVTALVATEYINLDKNITITKAMIVPTSKPRLWPGEEVRAFNLMYPLLLESSNEVATVYADTIGFDRFVSLMNAKVAALGLLHTSFVDPAGSDALNVSTAQDLFAFLKYLAANQTFFLNVSAGRLNKDLGSNPGWSGLENFNGFDGSPEFVGGKIGKIEAVGETLASIFRVQMSGTERQIGIVVLGSANAITDTATLVDYVKEMYASEKGVSPTSTLQSP